MAVQMQDGLTGEDGHGTVRPAVVGDRGPDAQLVPHGEEAGGLGGLEGGVAQLTAQGSGGRGLEPLQVLRAAADGRKENRHYESLFKRAARRAWAHWRKERSIARRAST